MNEIIVKDNDIKNMIYEVRGKQVMLDSDVAYLYGYTTKRLNEVVKRNQKRFPENFCFRLTLEETNSLRSQNATLKKGRGEHKIFIEQGVDMSLEIYKTEKSIKNTYKRSCYLDIILFKVLISLAVILTFLPFIVIVCKLSLNA